MIYHMRARDPHYDGVFIVGVKTTGIYCLPSCRSPRMPKPENVEFYATPEEARATGLRPCKLCKPDDFYMGHHAEEALVEGLVVGMALDPGAFRSVSTVVAASGVSASKLHELFRTHYHATPADLLARSRIAAARKALRNGERRAVEIAFEIGFESLSAFNENFRKYTGMSPLRYRRLREGMAFDISLPENYPLSWILRYLGRNPQSNTERIKGNTLVAAFRLDDRRVPAIRVECMLLPGRARCRIHGSSPSGAGMIEQIHERILATLGLTIDPSRFETLIASIPDLAPLVAGRRGLRLPLVADPFDGLVRAVVGQQIARPLADTLRGRLVERVGTPIDSHLFAPPSPQAVAALDPGDLTSLGFSQAKAEYLISAARSVADGRLPLAALAGKSATRIERTLRAVRGIGSWSAHYLMMHSYGFLDCVPVGDASLTTALQRFFALDARPGRHETLVLMDRFSPYRTLATLYLSQYPDTAA